MDIYDFHDFHDFHSRWPNNSVGKSGSRLSGQRLQWLTLTADKSVRLTLPTAAEVREHLGAKD